MLPGALKSNATKLFSRDLVLKTHKLYAKRKYIAGLTRLRLFRSLTAALLTLVVFVHNDLV